MSERVFGRHESEAMFTGIFATLDQFGKTGAAARGFVVELQGERQLLLESHSALAALLRAVGSENFNRRSGEMSASLRAAIRQAEQALA